MNDLYNKYFEYLLKNDPKKVLSEKGIELRKLLSPLVRAVIVPLSSKNKLHIERKSDFPKDRPIIFASTHGFRDDIAFAIKAIDVPSYILLGSLMVFFHSFDGVGLWLNGTILVDRKDKNSRAASKDKMIYALKNGANLLMYPEGVWNKTENVIVQKLFPGIYDVAKETGALVVPIASIEEDGVVHCIIDESFNICEYDRQKGLCVLRDKMATCKYELMEKYSKARRADFSDSYWSEFLEELIKTAKGLYDYEIENTAHFVDKNETNYSDAFSHLKTIKYSPKNAFLLNVK